MSSLLSKSLRLSLVAIFGVCVTPANAAEPWTDLIKQVDTKSAAAGSWKTENGALQTSASAGSCLALPLQPTGEYDFKVSFTRNSGVHSVVLIFVAGNGQAGFEIDAWGQHLAGIQNVKGETVRTNATKVENQTLKNGQKYTVEIRVRKDHVNVYLDDQKLVGYRGNGSDLSMSDFWKLKNAKALGIGAWQPSTTFHSIQLRAVSGQLKSTPSSPPRTVATTTPTRPTTTAPTTRPAATPNSPRPMPTRPNASGGGKGRVLIVIANDGFFYREYAHPREELEKAGFIVEVAAGLPSVCQPHANSGQGRSSGIVRPDLTIDKVDSKRYVGILFSGGWGSSMYQFAFRGSYDNRAYNGTRQIKATANRLINEFVDQDKHVAALCHGVSVLAWSRRNGRSLLRDRRATGPTRQGPSGIYNGQRAQPPSRWNAETNGAKMVAPNSVGNPRSAADDVVIDDKLLTGQDDITAREMGRQLAIELSK